MQLIHIAFLLQWHYQQVRSFLCHSYTTIDHCKSVSVVDVSSRWWRLTYSEAMQGLFSTQWVHTHTWPPSSQSIYTIIIVTKTIILSLMCAHAWWLCIFTWACCYLCMNCLAEIYIHSTNYLIHAPVGFCFWLFCLSNFSIVSARTAERTAVYTSWLMMTIILYASGALPTKPFINFDCCCYIILLLLKLCTKYIGCILPLFWKYFF